MGQLNDYLSFFEKANKRLRNEEITLLPKLDLMRRSDFEAEGAPPPKIGKLHAELEKMAKRFNLRRSPRRDTTRNTASGR